MKYFADLHIHTVASQHAYSTIAEIARYAKEIGVPVVGIADHGPAMLDGPREYYFNNLMILPDIIEGTRVLKGVELNIVDDEGNVDLKGSILRSLDYAIASFHPGIAPVFYTKKEYTEGYMKVCHNPSVNILGHIDNPMVDFDEEKVLQEIRATEKIIEVNNASYGTVRPGSFDKGLRILQKAKKLEIPIMVNSDAHYHEDVGRFDQSHKLICEVDYPEELIMNSSMDRLKKAFPNV